MIDNGLIYSMSFRKAIVDGSKTTVSINVSTEITHSLEREEIFIDNKSVSIKWYLYSYHWECQKKMGFWEELFHTYTDFDYYAWVEVDTDYKVWFEEEYQSVVSDKKYIEDEKRFYNERKNIMKIENISQYNYYNFFYGK